MSTSRTNTIHRRLTALGMGAIVAAGLLTPALSASADAAVIAVEGEAPTSTTFTPGTVAAASASGGQYLQLNNAAAAPTGGYTASYEVTAPTAGIYRLDATTNPINVGWASPYSFSVNGGTAQATGSATLLQTIDSSFRRYTLGAVTLAEGSNTITFAVDQRRVEPNTNHVMFLDQFTLTETPVAITSVAATEQLGVFERGEAATVDVVFNAALPAATDVAYEVVDYWGAAVTSGTVPAAAAAGSVEIPLGAALPVGYYRVTASALSAAPVTGAISVAPALADRTATEDSPFAMDVYGSKLIATADMEAFARVLELSGVDWIRDRQRWNDEVNPSAGSFNFPSQVQEDDWLAAANAVGIKTLSSFHTAPAWTKQSGDNMANDLLSVYEFGLQAGTYYSDTIQAWQIWNEQNRGFSTTQEAADQYASFLKAASIGFQDSGSPAQLTTGGLAGVDPHYADMMYRNEVLDYVDVFAYHTHTTDNYASSIDDHPAFASQLTYALEHGGDTKGRWVTEAGIALNQGDTATLPDVQQNTAQARYLVTSAIESLAGGTTKQFFFIGAPYREGQTWWSMFRTPTEPMASYAAQAVATDVLGEATYAGAIPGLAADVRAHVVKNGSDSVAVLWAPTVRTVSVDLGATSAVLTDIMGASTTVTASAGSVSVEVGPDPVYLTVAGDVPGLTAAPAPIAQAPLIADGEFTTAERVVLQQSWSSSATANSQTNGYGLSTTAANPLTVTVVNLNDAAVTVDLSIAVDGGWQLDTAASTLTVAAKSTATVPVSVTAGTEVRQTASELAITGTIGGAAVSPSISDLVPLGAALVTRHVVQGLDDLVRVDYRNAGSTVRTVTAVEWDFGAGTVTSTGLPATVAAGATATFTSPAVALTGDVDYEARVVFSDGTVLSALGTAVIGEATAIDRHTVVVDGTVEVLDSVANVPLVGDGVDPASQTARAAFTWDDDFLYLSAVVEDDVFTQSWTGNATWQGDSIQFAIAPNHPGETMARPELQVRTEFGLSLTSTGPQLYRYASNGVAGQLVTTAQVAVVHDAASGEIRYEVGVPWSLVAPITPAGGVASSLSIAVNDNDDGKRRGWVSWGGGITTSKDTELYEPVVFVGSSTAAITAGTNSRAVCWGDDQVRVAAYAYNNGANPVDVRLRTDFGTKVIAGVMPGKGAYNAFPTGAISIQEFSASITIVDTVTGASRTDPFTVAGTSCA